ncbi:MAG: ThiF family adenylyltransferase [Flavobacteriales bacterium]
MSKITASFPDDAALRIAVIGIGGIGCAVLPRMARWPLARLTLIDGDRVEEDNLDRQELYAEMDIGAWKSGVSAAWMRQIIPAASVEHHAVFLGANNARELLAEHDAVIECTDDLHAKQAIDEACAALAIPLVSGGVHGTQGQVIALHGPGNGHALTRKALFAGRSSGEQDGCDMRNVPMGTLDAVARRMVSLTRSLLLGEAVVNGRIELLSGDRWTNIDPPTNN